MNCQKKIVALQTTTDGVKAEIPPALSSTFLFLVAKAPPKARSCESDMTVVDICFPHVNRNTLWL